MLNKDALPGTLLTVKRGNRQGSLTLVVAREAEPVSYPVSENFYLTLGEPPAGTLLTEDQLERLTLHADGRRALATALDTLARGDISQRELFRKLRQKGHTAPASEAAVAEVMRLGYLREEEGAQRLCHLCAAKGWSRKKTRAYLGSKGYDGDTISRAIHVCEEAGEADFEGNRAAFLQKQLEKGLSPDAVRRALWRAGF